MIERLYTQSNNAISTYKKITSTNSGDNPLASSLKSVSSSAQKINKHGNVFQGVFPLTLKENCKTTKMETSCHSPHLPASINKYGGFYEGLPETMGQKSMILNDNMQEGQKFIIAEKVTETTLRNKEESVVFSSGSKLSIKHEILTETIKVRPKTGFQSKPRSIDQQQSKEAALPEFIVMVRKFHQEWANELGGGFAKKR